MATGSELDFRDNTPAASAGYQLGKFQKGPTSGTDPAFGLPIYPLSTEVPATGGVSKLTTNAMAAAGDCGKLLSFTLSSPATYTLPATAPSVPDGGGTNRWKVTTQNVPASAASLTIAATTPAKLDGITAGTLVLAAGSGVDLYTDGTDYFTERGAGATNPIIGFVLNDGSSGTNVGPMLAAPRAGSFTKCVVVTKASDAITALTFKIKKNGTDIFSSDPSITAGTSSGTVSTFTSLTSSPLAVAANDVFSIDVTSGASDWQATIQLE